jgi:hypothetical protein
MPFLICTMIGMTIKIVTLERSLSREVLECSDVSHLAYQKVSREPNCKTVFVSFRALDTISLREITRLPANGNQCDRLAGVPTESVGFRSVCHAEMFLFNIFIRSRNEFGMTVELSNSDTTPLGAVLYID